MTSDLHLETPIAERKLKLKPRRAMRRQLLQANKPISLDSQATRTMGGSAIGQREAMHRQRKMISPRSRLQRHPWFFSRSRWITIQHHQGQAALLLHRLVLLLLLLVLPTPHSPPTVFQLHQLLTSSQLHQFSTVELKQLLFPRTAPRRLSSNMPTHLKASQNLFSRKPWRPSAPSLESKLIREKASPMWTLWTARV